MVCAGCKNLDTKKKANGAVSGVRYMCKKHKKYVGGDHEVCDKFTKAYRDNDAYNKLYDEGRKWDNDKTSPGVYIIAAIVLLIITFIIFLFNSSLYGI